jgi:hypothetical protein
MAKIEVSIVDVQELLIEIEIIQIIDINYDNIIMLQIEI